MEAILETKKLSHIYSAGTPFERGALLEVDFTAYAGEYLGIIGHTGSGKSTLIQHLNGLLKPTSGQVLFQGEDIWADAKRTRQTRFQVGLVFQYPEYQLFEETVYKDISFGPKNMGLDEGEVDRRVREAARFVGLRDDQLEKSPFELSGGQKRRVAIAGVIAMEPRVLILDEPTAGLDPVGVESHPGQHPGTITSPTMPPSSWSPTPWRRWPARWTGWWWSTTAASPFRARPGRCSATVRNWSAWGLGVPQMTRVFSRLRAMGVDIDASVYTIPQAKETILRRLREKGVE